MSSFRGGLPAAQTHAHLKAALAQLRRAEKNAVLWFAEILHRKLYRELGYSSIRVYAGEALGFSPSKTSQFIRMADSLQRLPALRQSLASGKLSWTKAREVAKVATAGDEKRWISRAVESSNRELEADVKRSRELARSQPECTQSSLLDAFSAEELDREHSVQLEATLPEGLDRDQAGKRSFERCLPITERPQATSLRFSPVERARFDAVVEKIRKTARSRSLRKANWEILVLAGLEALLESEAQGAAKESPEPSDEAADFTRVKSASPYQIIVHRCECCGSAEIQAGGARQRLSIASFERIACDAKILEPGQHNRSMIPPATRRAVLARDGHRCQVKGCSGARFLEVHHVIPRSKGGSNRPENLITLCSACHQLLHENSDRGALLMIADERALAP